MLKDSNLKTANQDVHPELQPYLVMNVPGQGTVYFTSFYDESHLVKRCRALRPWLYPEKEPETQKILELKPGGYLRLPHSQYKMHTRDGSKVQLRYPHPKDL